MKAEEKKWRTCLGRSEACKKQVLGMKDERFCSQCRVLHSERSLGYLEEHAGLSTSPSYRRGEE